MFSRSEKLIIGILASIQFSNIVDFMIMMPLGPQLMRLFQIDPHQFGLLVSIYTFTASISGFIASFFVDRFDRKSLLLFFYSGFTIGTIACAFSNSYNFFLIARAITGMFGGVLGSLVLAVVSDVINIERRGTAMGIVMASFSVASVLGVPISIFVANKISWHMPFVLVGIISALIIILILVKFPKMNQHLKGPTDHDTFAAISHIFKSPHQLMALSFLFLLVFGQFSIIPFLSPSFVANGGLPEADLPLIYLFGGLVSMVSSPLFGRLSDRYGKKKVFGYSVLYSLIPIYLVTNLPVSPIPVIVFISSLFFIGMGGRMVPAMALISSTATPKYRASFMSLSSSTQQFSSALSSYISGIIVVKGAGGTLENYHLVGFIAIGFSILALIISQKVKPVEGNNK